MRRDADTKDTHGYRNAPRLMAVVCDGHSYARYFCNQRRYQNSGSGATTAMSDLDTADLS